MKGELNIKNQLVQHLESGLAFASIDNMLDAIPFEKLGIRPHNLPYSFYEIFYHMVFAQKDILDYIISEKYSAGNWPEDYWPAKRMPKTTEEWEELKNQFFENRLSLKEFLLDSDRELNEPVINSSEHSLLCEVMLVIEHNAYHTGQLLLIQRLLGVQDN
jgi:uncharacterized damage-inducible protein DinB